MTPPAVSDAAARDLVFVVAALAMFAVAVDVWSAYQTYPEGQLAQLVVGGAFALLGVVALLVRFTALGAKRGGSE